MSSIPVGINIPKLLRKSPGSLAHSPTVPVSAILKPGSKHVTDYFPFSTAITGTWAAPFAIYSFILSSRIVSQRMKHEIYSGDKLDSVSSSPFSFFFSFLFLLLRKPALCNAMQPFSEVSGKCDLRESSSCSSGDYKIQNTPYWIFLLLTWVYILNLLSLLLLLRSIPELALSFLLPITKSNPIQSNHQQPKKTNNLPPPAIILHLPRPSHNSNKMPCQFPR